MHLMDSTTERVLALEKLNLHQMFENVVGCKWSLTVIDLVRRGVNRPGAMEHAIDG